MGSEVQLVGRVGDDATGDAVLFALAQAGVGHVAVLRDAAFPTPVVTFTSDDDAESLLVGDDIASATRESDASRRPTLDPEDVSLGLEYLNAFSVLVVTDDVPASALAVAVDAAAFAAAHLVLVLPRGTPVPDGVPADATVLSAPDDDDGDALAALVGRYAAGLDRGVPATEAFSAALHVPA
jgi:sugar/nucleoside kinase (ribokinase family)